MPRSPRSLGCTGAAGTKGSNQRTSRRTQASRPAEDVQVSTWKAPAARHAGEAPARFADLRGEVVGAAGHVPCLAGRLVRRRVPEAVLQLVAEAGLDAGGDQ